jgi:hypothetical protein
VATRFDRQKSLDGLPCFPLGTHRFILDKYPPFGSIISCVANLSRIWLPLFSILASGTFAFAASPETEPIFVTTKSFSLPGAFPTELPPVFRPEGGVILAHSNSQLIALNANLEQDWTATLPRDEGYSVLLGALGPTHAGGSVVPFASALPGVIKIGPDSGFLFNVSFTNEAYYPAFAAELNNRDTLAIFESHNRESGSVISRLGFRGAVRWTNHVDSKKRVVQHVESSDGSILIAGSLITNRPGALPDSDVWFRKLSASGQVLWEKSYGTPYFDGLRIVRDQNGTFFAAAESLGLGADNIYDTDTWILALDSEGNLIRDARFGTPEHESVQAFTYASEDTFVLATAGNPNNARLSIITSGLEESRAVHISTGIAPRFLGILSEHGSICAFFSHSGSIHCAHLTPTGDVIALQDLGLANGIFSLRAVGAIPGGAILAGFDRQTAQSGTSRAYSLLLTNQPFGKPTVFSSGFQVNRAHFRVDGSASVRILISQPNAAIYYTTNGTVPTTSSAPYRPFTLTSNAVVRAIAVFGEKIVHSEEVFVEVRPHLLLTVDCAPGGVVSAEFAMDAESGEMRTSSYNFYSFNNNNSSVLLIQGTRVRLSAQPQGAVFMNWGGDIESESQTVEFTLEKPLVLYARFAAELSLPVVAEGAASTDFGSGLIPCGYVWYFAEPKDGYYHTGWLISSSIGNIFERGGAIVRSHAPGLTAPIPRFAPLPSDSVDISVQHVGPGDVSIVPHKRYYTRGELVTLTPRPGVAFTNLDKPKGNAFFTGWTGSVQSSTPVLRVRADSNMVLRATFSGIHNQSFTYAVPSTTGLVNRSTNLLQWTPAGALHFNGIVRYDSIAGRRNEFLRRASQ